MFVVVVAAEPVSLPRHAADRKKNSQKQLSLLITIIIIVKRYQRLYTYVLL